MKEQIKHLLACLEHEIFSSINARDPADSTNWEAQEGVLISRQQAELIVKILKREEFISDVQGSAEQVLREIVDEHYRKVPAVQKEPFAYHHPDDVHRRLALRAMREFTEDKTIQITQQTEKIKEAVKLIDKLYRATPFHANIELLKKAAEWLQSVKIKIT